MKYKSLISLLIYTKIKKLPKPFIGLVMFLSFADISFSQDLYVGNNTYLYAKDVVVTVTNDIRLETPTSNLYFRGDAQLYQIADVKNSDAGNFSIYQNQTTNIYEYNYWCSPVGVSVDGTTKTNVDFNGSNIYDPVDATDLANINSTSYLYTTAYNGTATELSSYWMHTLKDGEGYYSWKKISNTGDVGTGYGFTQKGSPNINNVLDFRGRPNNGTITVSCSFDGVDNQPNSGTPNYAETLTGNPYPSALDLKLFLIHPNNDADLSGEIFFWEQKQKNSHYLVDYEGGYSTYAPGDPFDLFDNGNYAVAPFENYNGDGSTIGTTSLNTTDFSANNQRRFAAIGQGFVIASNVNGGDAIFENSMRVYFPEDSNPGGDGSIFAKNKNLKNNISKEKIIPQSNNGVDYNTIVNQPTIIPEIRLHTHIDNTFYKENVIAFRESTPNNNVYNKFYDARNINELSSDAYLVSSDKELVVKSINYAQDVKIPFGLKTSKTNSNFSISINRLKETPESLEVYVFDKLTNVYTDVVNGTFNINLPKGTYNNRFEITFTKNTLSTDFDEFKSVEVYHNNNSSSLTINNPKAINIESFKLFDATGKLVLNKKIRSKQTTQSYSTKSLSDGVYIVNILLENDQFFSKKIIVGGKK
ncbi:T9SS type A sorting domain-containing protein [Mariniflexile gromovii]|uniref:T9SS type A sorting domain-containing protein n=1 Tax=Mariniflexile gromovii TaxID=362523 RepID=A0ABS4BZK2_9FLAO|nr:T9SS type A sorting domain-containing protein [Mariniflexile gromovii]MBP0905546.1 T9SS type A sorting domain-containing protein [Mariniflexile gromovii]